MKKIPLTQGQFALVDDIDYEYLCQWKWYARKARHGFYACRGNWEDGRQKIVRMHRVVAARKGIESSDPDHINRNPLDNRRSNLREASNKQNQENVGLRSDNTSGHRGVYWDRNKWRARIKHNGKLLHLGSFDELKDAIAARKHAERKYFTHA